MVLQNIYMFTTSSFTKCFISPFLNDLCGKKLTSFVVYSPISSPDKISGRENLPIALHPPKIFSVYLSYFYFLDWVCYSSLIAIFNLFKSLHNCFDFTIWIKSYLTYFIVELKKFCPTYSIYVYFISMDTVFF